ncbi:zinc ribbon domain-containing protein [Roseimaritima sediminicola]|uniref:zinc ribbon domain-containing protein n=1 Tax=Roseimaritima sediminicola TaxID=2662066 RepID=UPI0013875CA7|nr:zinc ribbon domain-containing protein [Roseimaritima sediminicola]
MVPCPHCGAAVAIDAEVCRACGYDWDQYVDHPDSDAEDDFDYDEFIASEFSDSPVSTTLRPWQRAVVIALVVAFAATLLWPVLF